MRKCVGVCGTLHSQPSALHCGVIQRRSSHTPHPTPCTLRPTCYTLHPIPYTLHLAPYAQHATPYTLYPIPYTLRPTPCTHSVAPPDPPPVQTRKAHADNAPPPSGAFLKRFTTFQPLFEHLKSRGLGIKKRTRPTGTARHIDLLTQTRKAHAGNAPLPRY